MNFSRNMDELKVELKKVVKDRGLKYTEQREIILEVLLNAPGHLSAEEIYNELKAKHPETNIGIATVYRALSFLEDVHMITSISFGTDGKKYETNTKSHHDHLICTSCGKIVEFMDETIENKQEEIANKNGFKVTNHVMQLFGLCDKCQ